MNNNEQGLLEKINHFFQELVNAENKYRENLESLNTEFESILSKYDGGNNFVDQIYKETNTANEAISKLVVISRMDQDYSNLFEFFVGKSLNYRRNMPDAFSINEGFTNRTYSQNLFDIVNGLALNEKRSKYCKPLFKLLVADNLEFYYQLSNKYGHQQCHNAASIDNIDLLNFFIKSFEDVNIRKTIITKSTPGNNPILLQAIRKDDCGMIRMLMTSIDYSDEIFDNGYFDIINQIAEFRKGRHSVVVNLIKFSNFAEESHPLFYCVSFSDSAIRKIIKKNDWRTLDLILPFFAEQLEEQQFSEEKSAFNYERFRQYYSLSSPFNQGHFPEDIKDDCDRLLQFKEKFIEYFKKKYESDLESKCDVKSKIKANAAVALLLSRENSLLGLKNDKYLEDNSEFGDDTKFKQKYDERHERFKELYEEFQSKVEFSLAEIKQVDENLELSSQDDDIAMPIDETLNNSPASAEDEIKKDLIARMKLEYSNDLILDESDLEFIALAVIDIRLKMMPTSPQISSPTSSQISRSTSLDRLDEFCITT
ncbi:MAG: hypothetical protein ISQ34_05620 [Rickettsiales bacterium]|nr:hypothetical protein [Rickettsiales bacterium]